MNDAMRKQIVALKLNELVDELEWIQAEDDGVDGNSNVWEALEQAADAVRKVHYLATTPLPASPRASREHSSSVRLDRDQSVD